MGNWKGIRTCMYMGACVGLLSACNDALFRSVDSVNESHILQQTLNKGYYFESTNFSSITVQRGNAAAVMESMGGTSTTFDYFP